MTRQLGCQAPGRCRNSQARTPALHSADRNARKKGLTRSRRMLGCLRELELEPAAIERAAAEPRGSGVLVWLRTFYQTPPPIRRWGFLFARPPSGDNNKHL